MEPPKQPSSSTRSSSDSSSSSSSESGKEVKPVLFPSANSIQRASGSRSTAENDFLSPTRPVVKPRAKIILEPGHSPLDWAKLKASGQSLHTQTQLQKITLEELKEHRSEKDAWVALRGKVFDVTYYLDYHPGGKSILLKAAAGRDCSDLFRKFNISASIRKRAVEKYHPWVNADYLLDKCLIGFLQRN